MFLNLMFAEFCKASRTMIQGGNFRMLNFRSVATAVAASLLLASCGGGSESGTASTLDPVAVAPTPTPTPTPTAVAIAPPKTASIVGADTTEGFPQMAEIPSNFSMTGMLQASWGTGAIPGPESGIGAFRFLCRPSHLAYDDPIVFPGQSGRSHLHMFFGNTLADAKSDYQSLRTTGLSTCNDALNRSAYWMPALLDGNGKVVMPDYISIYYKRVPNTHPLCADGKGCIAMPRGLRFVFGRTMSGGRPPYYTGTYFNCDGPGAVAGHYDSFAEAAKNCPSGAKIGVILNAPMCWNGKDLDSPDHRSHMAYDVQDGNGTARCPTTHPYRVPSYQLAAWYTTDDTLDRSGNASPDTKTWYFASDRMAGMTPMATGETVHADWYGAWDDATMRTWMANCINLQLNCSGGDLGNGTQMSFSAEYKRTYPRRVDVPPDPKA